ncbi:MAG: 3-deoxy-7-phosphoheptulonate synthase [Deferribacteraceae bacterium]|jgi:3-deoxy-7-phosphoheptulonate synthase|nr:3-deoxy-7-phosphoheptulonate synthase [Deferribacteraceae bacterium]
MLIRFHRNTDEDSVNKLKKSVEQTGGSAFYLSHAGDMLMVVNGCNPEFFSNISSIESVLNIDTPYQLANRALHPEGSVVNVGNATFQEGKFTVIAGPCSVESFAQFKSIGESVKPQGAKMLRGGAYKPRTSPYSFQGLGEDGLKIMSDVAKSLDLPLVSELIDPRDADVLYKYADMIQIGTRNALNFPLLRLVGEMGKPVLLKRGQSSTVKELLTASEYILSCGNFDLILCERGIRTFEDSTRNTLDISAVPVLKKFTHLPIIIDPSHAAGRAEYVTPLALAAVAAGADGIITEVHCKPQEALSDKEQALSFEQFETLMNGVRAVAKAVGKEM